jgi:CubicO group peptidase (beta-lactamase class C family)
MIVLQGLRQFIRASCAVVFVVCVSGPAHADDLAVAGNPEGLGFWPTEQWQTSTPEEQGMDSAALAKLVAFGTTRSFDSLLIARHGRIVLDAYYAPYTADIPHAINSSTKAVIGSLVAIAHRDGLLDSFEHPMLDFFKARSIANVDDRKKAITIQNLLDMTSGIEWEEGFEGGREQSLIDWGRSPDGIQFILDRPMSSAPGDRFYYNSGNPHLLSAIITKLTGKSAEEYANAELFGPLGIATAHWRRDPQGFSTGGGGLALLPRDMAKIGYLYLHHGKWDDQQILPPEWIDRVSHATINMNASFTADLRYSNFFWALPNKNVYMAVGYHCQVIMVFPERDIVAVTTARDFCPFGKMADSISGAVKSDTALPADPAAANLLAGAIRDISAEKPAEVGATPEIASVIAGKIYTFPENALNIRSLSLMLTDPQPHYELEIHNPTIPALKFSGPIGLDGRYRKAQPTALGVMAVRGTWSDGHTFVIDLQYLGAGEQRKWTLSFDGERLSVHGKDREGHEVSANGELAGLR